ncbi:hypothetical protein [Cobetia sp. L2A1]|uniref:hypothetical protein n=1 Tax=Cobetia sp. L2A1 TaxID=2686360 RepID=UPI00131E4298|nr:hypothetical protein [Cobetia sp. L2A1]
MKENDADIAVIKQFTTSFSHQNNRDTVSFFGRRHPLFKQVLKLRDAHHGASKAYLQKHKDHDDVIDSNSQHICLVDTQRDALMGSIRVTPGGLESRTLFDESEDVTIPEGSIYEFSRLVMDPSAKRFAHGNLLMAAAAKHVKAKDGDGILALCKRSNMKIFKRFGLLPLHESTLKTGHDKGELYMVYASMDSILKLAQDRTPSVSAQSPSVSTAAQFTANPLLHATPL